MASSLSMADAAEGSCLTPELIAALPTTREGVVELQAHLTEQLEADAPLTDLHGRAALMHLPRCAALAQYGGGDDMRVAAPYVCEPLDARAQLDGLQRLHHDSRRGHHCGQKPSGGQYQQKRLWDNKKVAFY